MKSLKIDIDAALVDGFTAYADSLGMKNRAIGERLIAWFLAQPEPALHPGACRRARSAHDCGAKGLSVFAVCRRVRRAEGGENFPAPAPCRQMSGLADKLTRGEPSAAGRARRKLPRRVRYVAAQGVPALVGHFVPMDERVASATGKPARCDGLPVGRMDSGGPLANVPGHGPGSAAWAFVAVDRDSGACGRRCRLGPRLHGHQRAGSPLGLELLEDDGHEAAHVQGVGLGIRPAGLAGDILPGVAQFVEKGLGPLPGLDRSANADRSGGQVDHGVPLLALPNDRAAGDSDRQRNPKIEPHAGSFTGPNISRTIRESFNRLSTGRPVVSLALWRGFAAGVGL